MTTKKKTVRKIRRGSDRDRNWRRDLLARDLFTALCVQSKWPTGETLAVWDDECDNLAEKALRAASQFEQTRAQFKRSK